ncbi:MAG: hypothetical protein HFI31_02020 [Lachnospiraceae bacterium]|jgi:hypothetical protein|nr:hypothetical protein [Lachnospiraceae bacterium]MCI8994378.1 hypothetical protein [Lachnospiraceae bacterium]MCI9132953.1 hypothetical protein [Lachnospiraceae bacterium]
MERSREKWKQALVPLLTALVLMACVLGPEQLARCRDRSMLNEITVEAAEGASQGYRYSLNSNEKLFLLAECLNHQVLPESEQSAKTRVENEHMDYEELMGTYAFVVNRQGPSGQEITDDKIFDTCNQEIETLKELGVLPKDVRTVEPEAYSAVLYSAIDVLEPQNHMSVWRVSLSTRQQNRDKAHRLIDAYIDAATGRIYGFYVRTERTWAELSPEDMVEAWSGYLGLTGREAYEGENPLLETTPDFVKYRFPGIDEGSTIVTIGFYEGINELFIK